MGGLSVPLRCGNYERVMGGLSVPLRCGNYERVIGGLSVPLRCGNYERVIGGLRVSLKDCQIVNNHAKCTHSVPLTYTQGGPKSGTTTHILKTAKITLHEIY